MNGQLLTTARPYLQILSLFSLTPPPSSYERSHHSWQWKLLMLIFSCYTCCTCLMSAYVCYVNSVVLNTEVQELKLQQELTVCEQHDLLQALVQAIRKNKNLHARIWKLVGEFEEYFMLPMLMLFLYNGVCILHNVNWAYIQALNPKDTCRFWRIGFLLLLVLNLLIPCWISHNCITTYNSFGRILHNIRGGSGLVTPQLLKMILMEYALQMEHLKLRFTCGGFFDINLKYFAGMVASIISYNIILIQFKLQAMLEAKQAAKRHLSLSSNSKMKT
ncbi:hypothetical protein ACLKA6_014401 [Drosophila palustris]